MIVKHLAKTISNIRRIIPKEPTTTTPTTTEATTAPSTTATAAAPSTTQTTPPATTTGASDLARSAITPQSGQHPDAPTAGQPNSAVERVVGITTFIDAEDTMNELNYSTSNTDMSILNSHDDEAENLERILTRPTFMQNFDWTSAQGIGALVSNYNLPQDILGISAIKRQKLQYNQFLKSDIVFRLISSPIQFQAGRLWICFEPYRDQRGGRALPIGATGNPTQFTALPGIAYDPGNPNPVELRIPFASILSAWDLPIGQFGFGSLLIFVLSPLNSASTTNTMTLSIQSWMENTEIRVPTLSAASTVPTRSDLWERTESAPMRFEAREDNVAQTHRFSTALSRISNVATALSMFPLLSAVASPVASFASLASKAAAYFGFAKPADMSAPTKITQHNRHAWTNSDGALPLSKLTHSSENAVDLKGRYFPSPIDEMDISYIVSNPVVLNQWVWSSTDEVGKLITVLPVHPGLANKVSGPGSYTFGTFQPTPLAYVASMFKYWAGSMKFKMEAVSTPFHAGRLMVVYVPDYNPIDASFSINEVGNFYSVAWDITDSSQLDFEVPYIGNTPFLDVFLDDQACSGLINGETTGLEPRNRYRKIGNGAIVVFVLNKLVAPSAAASSISIMNWVAGGKDMTFAEPTFGAFRSIDNGATSRIDYSGNWYDGTAMTAVSNPGPPALRFEANFSLPQSLQITRTTSAYSAATGLAPSGPDAISGTTAQLANYPNFIPMTYIDPQQRAKLCMGEVITNLRTLTRRLAPAYIMYPQDVTTAGAWDTNAKPVTQNHVMVVDPDYFGTGDGENDSSVYNKQIASVAAGGNKWLTELETPLSYISKLYAFARGSRLYGISSKPCNIVNGAAFTTLADEIELPGDKGTFEARLTSLIDEDSPPRQPYFRPDETLIGYNFENKTSGTLSSINYSYGFNNALSSNALVEKSGESGCGLVIQVPPTSKYPFKLLATPSSTEINFIKSLKYSAPRSRRFLEIRYRPFSSSGSEDTSNYRPKLWPFPTTFMEAAADDFSFGSFLYAPRITKVQKTIVFPNYTTGAKVAF